MKKLFSIVACLICAAMLATTGFAAQAAEAPEPPDAYSIYKKASKSLDAAKSIEMHGTSKTTMEMGGVEIGTMTQFSTIKMLYTADDKIEMEMKNQDSDTNMTVDMYYKDGYMYQSFNGENTKYKLDIEEAVASAGAFDTALGEDFFKDATVEQTDSGTRVKFKIDFDELKNIDGGSILDEIYKSMPDAKIETSDISYSMLFDNDNNLRNYAIAFNMTIEYQGMTITAKNNTVYTIVSIDRVSEIKFPADLKAYKLA